MAIAPSTLTLIDIIRHLGSLLAVVTLHACCHHLPCALSSQSLSALTCPFSSSKITLRSSILSSITLLLPSLLYCSLRSLCPFLSPRITLRSHFTFTFSHFALYYLFAIWIRLHNYFSAVRLRRKFIRSSNIHSLLIAIIHISFATYLAHTPLKTNYFHQILSISNISSNIFTF